MKKTPINTAMTAPLAHRPAADWITIVDELDAEIRCLNRTAQEIQTLWDKLRGTDRLPAP